MQIRLTGEDSVEIAATLSNMGAIQKNLKFEYYERSNKIFVKKHGQIHPTVATCNNNIATLLKLQGKLPQALEKYSKSKELFEAIYTATHPTVATLLNNIGMISESMGRNDQAIENYALSLKIYIELYGEKHAQVGSLNYSLGLLYYKIHDIESAIESFSKALHRRSGPRSRKDAVPDRRMPQSEDRDRSG
eukprot:CAMPEP_0176463718 /NCGR_PEP_ID=MMETSP0127-20121128/36063_1 /TAXON_ID=938130 /ORGANISM="Platyophrya macrostoma, Strain WH" /LENGTH=190 /DNA_ID=CAMNT_0017855947 /DNA_START=45 /DNA_END=618 /DNA_ORIENTATION=-